MKLTYFKDLIKENAWFFVCFALFLVVGALLLLTIDQGDEIFYFSDRRTVIGDLFFRYATRLGEGAGFVIVALIFLFVRFRTSIYIPLLGMVVMLTSGVTKKIFAHPRPWLYFQQLNMTDQLHLVAGVHVNGGANAFPSGHTMAAFALYAFLAFILPKKQGWAVVLFLIALLVGVSRIYLVQHFLKDVYLGAILGVIIAIIFHYLHNKYPDRLWADRSLLKRRKPITEA